MNNYFYPQHLKQASKYLDKKLKSIDKPYKNVYIIDEKKESFFSRIMNSIFK